VEAAAQESADWGAFTDRIQKYMDYQDGQIQKLRSEITELKDDRTYDREHIRVLQRQIWARLPHPPMKPGDPFPDDQDGGEHNTRLSRATPLRWLHSFKELLPCRIILPLH